MPIAQIFKKPDGCPVKIWTDDVEASARTQLENLSKLPFIHEHIAVMPDVHWGTGSTVGSVVPTIRAIVPAAVGVDIGCGMVANKLMAKAHQLPDNLSELRSAIEAAIPHGRTDNGGLNDRGAWAAIPNHVQVHYKSLAEDKRLLAVTAEEPNAVTSGKRFLAQLGTLGTGNHFVEVCLDGEDNVWIMLHSGSRGVGNRLGTHFIAKAKEEMERWHIHLPDKDLAYLPEGSKYFDLYWKAVSWAQDYAFLNRTLMLKAAVDAFQIVTGLAAAYSATAVNCHHNYVALEHHYGRDVYVTRKGAVRARLGDLGIIPGSMGARSFIVRGKGDPNSFHSCSHGAGRRMSRGEARRTFTVEDLAAQTAGVECRKDSEVVDEIPGAYKDIDAVMAHQTDLVEIVAELKQVLCVKG